MVLDVVRSPAVIRGHRALGTPFLQWEGFLLKEPEAKEACQYNLQRDGRGIEQHGGRDIVALSPFEWPSFCTEMMSLDQNSRDGVVRGPVSSRTPGNSSGHQAGSIDLLNTILRRPNAAANCQNL